MIKIIFSFIISAVFLFFALHGVQWQRLHTSLLQIDLSWIFIAALCQIFGILARGIRWGIQLKAGCFKNYWHICQCSIAGAMLNLILPARSGDIARVGLGSKYLIYPAGFLAVTVLIEMVIDTVVAANFTLLYNLFIENTPVWMVNLSRCIDLITLILIIALIFSKQLLFRYIDRLPKLGAVNKAISSLYEILRNIKKGITSLSSPWQIAKYGISIILLWIADICLILVLTTAITTNNTLGFKACIELSLALALSRLLPATLGYIGIYQFVILTILRPFGVEDIDSLSISIYLQLVALGSTLILGLICWHTVITNNNRNIRG